MKHFLEIAAGDGAHRHQRERGSFGRYRRMMGTHPAPAGLTAAESEFLQQRDSFYLASVGENGWPYVQHRGGPAGFVQVIDSQTIGWLERPGNRQYVSAGNLDTSARVALIAVDYPNRQRLKLLGNATYDTAPDPHLLARFGADDAFDALVTVRVEAFDWNCPKFITPRYTVDQIREIVEPINARIAELEAQLAAA